MDTPTTTDAESVSSKKKVVERSASYPGITIAEAFTFVTEIYKQFPGSRTFTREDAAAVLKTSALNRDFAAAKEYKFLNKEKDGFQVSILFKNLTNPLGDKERRKCLLEAFGSPKLYAELISKYDGHAIPTEIKTVLIRFHKIVDKVAPFAAQLFVDNGKYVGAINENGILNYKEALDQIGDPKYDYVSDEPAEELGDESPPSTGQVIDITPKGQEIENKVIEHSQTEEKIRVPLTNKKCAYIIYPSTINQKDIDILKKQIELLEILVT